MSGLNKAKTLTLGNLQSDGNRFFKTVEKTLSSKSGEQYKIRFKENIKESDIADFFSGLVQKIDYCNKNDVEFNMFNTYMFGILSCCVDIPNIKGKDVVEVINKEEVMLEIMLDLGLYQAILAEIGKERIDMITKTITKAENKEMLDLLSDKQISNLILNNKLEISDGENI